MRRERKLFPRSLAQYMFVAAAVCQVGCAGDGPEIRLLVSDANEMVLRIECTPAQAEVSIDGVFQGSCELLGKKDKVIKLPAGRHTLAVRADGYRDFNSIVEARGMLQKLTVNLSAIPDL